MESPERSTRLNVGNTKDAATGIPVYSVYGGTDAARRPSLDVLKQLDAVVFDIQDAGVRFYTYETTLGYFLEAAAKAGIEVIVLDRPDPDHRIVCAGSGVGCGTRELHELLDGAGAPRNDHGRTGEDVQRGAEHQRQADRGADGRLAARRLVRFDRAGLGESVAEFAQRDRSGAVSRQLA